MNDEKEHLLYLVDIIENQFENSHLFDNKLMKLLEILF